MNFLEHLRAQPAPANKLSASIFHDVALKLIEANFLLRQEMKWNHCTATVAEERFTVSLYAGRGIGSTSWALQYLREGDILYGNNALVRQARDTPPLCKVLDRLLPAGTSNPPAWARVVFIDYTDIPVQDIYERHCQEPGVLFIRCQPHSEYVSMLEQERRLEILQKRLVAATQESTTAARLATSNLQGLQGVLAEIERVMQATNSK